MPALAFHRQPPLQLGWFATVPGLRVLHAESGPITRLLAARPAQPVLWLRPAAIDDTPPPARGLRLHREGAGFGGALRMHAPWPLPSESFGCVIWQHVSDDGSDPASWLEECARVLMPGGMLWLSALNPWSPYRARWRGQGLQATDIAGWRGRARQSGLHVAPDGTGWNGPAWRDAAGYGRLCAAWSLQAEKRSLPLTPIMPARARRLQPALGQATPSHRIAA